MERSEAALRAFERVILERIADAKGVPLDHVLGRTVQPGGRRKKGTVMQPWWTGACDATKHAAHVAKLQRKPREHIAALERAHRA